ncbi:hypothetical protein G5I_11654 [Acromyrmex echinatior]|uniref:Uncharacterized protein n=1 Tax=Acromyrmex echinatior TaxID=103372 RepID=F4X097_ACREC|nr:hypothetical protein G5I_11654 [Acromyrmex echinatior]
MPLLFECNLVRTEYTTRYTAVRSVAPSAVQCSAAQHAGEKALIMRYRVYFGPSIEFCEIVAVNRAKPVGNFAGNNASFSPREIEPCARKIEEKINYSNDDERWEARSIWTVINAGGDRDSEGGTKRKTMDAGGSLKRHIAVDCSMMHRATTSVEAAPPTGIVLGINSISQTYIAYTLILKKDYRICEREKKFVIQTYD